MRPAGMCHTLIIRTEGSDRRVVNQCEDDREEGGEGERTGGDEKAIHSGDLPEHHCFHQHTRAHTTTTDADNCAAPSSPCPFFIFAQLINMLAPNYVDKCSIN